LKLTAGQADDGRHASDMLDRLGQGQILLADRGYDSDGLRARARRARRRGRRQAHHARSRQRPPFSRRLYRFRHLVERFFNKLKHNRAAATRFEKRDANDLARVKLAASRIWMRFMSRRPKSEPQVRRSRSSRSGS
jgi:transposase